MSEDYGASYDGGFRLSHMVQAQRGLSPREIEIFFATGQKPDLSQPSPEELEALADETQVMSEEDAAAWLSGGVLTASSFFDFDSSHGVSPLYEVVRPKVEAFRFDKNQPRDEDGKWTDGFPGVNLPDITSKPSGTKTGGSTKKVTPAVIYKKHDDGAVVGHSASGQRMRWDAGRKKFVVEKEKSGSWVEESAHTKTSAYNEMKKPDAWFEPSDDAPETPKADTTPEPELAPDVVNANDVEVDTAPAMDTPKETGFKKAGPDVLLHDGESVFTATKAAGQMFNYPGTKPYTPEWSARNDYVDEEVSVPLNRKLRQGKPLGPNQQQIADVMDDTIAKYQTEYDAEVFRGLRISDDLLDSWTTPGTTVTDPAFMSTATSREMAERSIQTNKGAPAMMRLLVPKGTNAAPGLVDAHGNDDGAGELVLGRNTSFQIVDAKKNENGLWEITAAVLSGQKAETDTENEPSSPSLTPEPDLADTDTTEPDAPEAPTEPDEPDESEMVDGDTPVAPETGEPDTMPEPEAVQEPETTATPEIPQQADAPEVESTPTTPYVGPSITDYAGLSPDIADRVRQAYLAEALHSQRVDDRATELRKADPDKYTGWDAYDRSMKDARAELDGQAPDSAEYDAAMDALNAAFPGDWQTADKIRRRLGIEATNEKMLTIFAEKNNLGPVTPELKADLARRTKEAFTGKKVAVRVSVKTVEHILGTGRIKSQFETNKSSGKKDVDMRASVEKLLFGIDDKPWQNAEKRPIYGYVALDGIRPAGIGSAQLGDPSTDALTQYGNVQVVLKDSVRNRTTAMFGDSLNNMQEGVPSPIDNPNWKSFMASRGGITGKGLEGLDRSGEGQDFRAGAYAEAQIHGGVGVEDIEEIVFPTNPTATVRDQLDKAGIPYRVLNFKTATDGSDEERATALRIAEEDKPFIEGEIAKLQEKLADPKWTGDEFYKKDLAKYEKQLKAINDALPLLEGTKTSPAKKVAAAKAKVANAKLTPDERKAIKTWQGADHTKIQKALRAGDTTPDVALLDSAIEKSAPLPKSTLYRGLTPDFMPDDLKTPGQVFTDLGFLATSKSQPNDTMFENYHHVIISTPDGAKGLDIGSGPYDEVLLPRGSRLRIDRVEQNRTMEGTTVTLYDVHATLLTDEESKASDAEVALPDVPKQPEAPKIESTPEALSTTAPGYAGPSVKIPPTLKQETIDEYLVLAVKQAKWEADPKSTQLTSAERMKFYQLGVEIGNQSDNTVRDRVEQLGKIEASLDAWRAEHDLTDTPTDVLKQQMADDVRQVFAGKKIGIRVTPQTLAVVLSDGRFKTQFETGTSAGYNDPKYRAKFEQQWFGIGQGLTSQEATKVEPKKRPLYGYVMVDGVRPAQAVDDDVLTWYGDIQVVFKDNVRSRTTAMFGDSLNDHPYGMPSPVDNPTWESFTSKPRGNPSEYGPPVTTWHPLTKRDRDVNDPTFKKTTYAEAQIHGGVSTDDIEEVIFAEQPDSTQITSQLDAAGIPWRVVDHNTVSIPKQAEAPKIESTPAEGVKMFSIPPSVAKTMQDEYIDLIKQQDFFGNLPDDKKKQQKNNLVKQITDMIDDKDEATRTIETLEQLGRVERTYDEFRARHNITTPAEEHKAELATKVKDAFADKDIAIRVTPESLSSILFSGRFMSQFESGLATGVQDMGGKARHEASWFGTSPRAKDDKEKRAIYGYVALNGIVPADSDGSAWKGGPDKLSMFGKVQVVLKKDVRSRTAAMYGDSAVNWSEGRLSPIDNPTWESFTGIGDPKNFSREKALRDLDRDPASFKFRSTAYAEAAITGGVTADDIAEVVFDKNPTPAIQEQLAEKGIPWRVLTMATAVKAAKPNEREPIRRMLVANVQHYEEAIKAAEAERDEYEAKGWGVKEHNTEIKKLNAQLTKAKNSLAKFVKVAA